MIVSTRTAAIAVGASRYFTGKPCKHGHIAERYVNGGCVPCKEAQATQWHADNPDERKKIEAKWCARNPEKVRAKTKRNHERNKGKAAAQRRANPEPAREACRKWRAAHPGAQAVATNRWAAKNPEKVLANRLKQKENGSAAAAARKWAAANPEKTSLSARKRRARKLDALGSHTTAELAVLRKKTGGRCAGCWLKRKLTVDHITPLTKGGSDFINNIQFLCQPCNSKKNNKDPIVFYQSQGFLL